LQWVKDFYATLVIDYVNFTYEDKSALEKEALTKAAQNAVERAKAIAAGLGVKVGSVIRVSGNRRSYDSGYYILRESSSYQAEGPDVNGNRKVDHLDNLKVDHPCVFLPKTDF